MDWRWKSSPDQVSAYMSVGQTLLGAIALVLAIWGYGDIKSIVVKEYRSVDGELADRKELPIVVSIEGGARTPIVMDAIEWWQTQWSESAALIRDYARRQETGAKYSVEMVGTDSGKVLLVVSELSNGASRAFVFRVVGRQSAGDFLVKRLEADRIDSSGIDSLGALIRGYVSTDPLLSKVDIGVPPESRDIGAIVADLEGDLSPAHRGHEIPARLLGLDLVLQANPAP